MAKVRCANIGEFVHAGKEGGFVRAPPKSAAFPRVLGIGTAHAPCALGESTHPSLLVQQCAFSSGAGEGLFVGTHGMST